jgi:hypothetical protein
MPFSQPELCKSPRTMPVMGLPSGRKHFEMPVYKTLPEWEARAAHEEADSLVGRSAAAA